MKAGVGTSPRTAPGCFRHLGGPFRKNLRDLTVPPWQCPQYPAMESSIGAAGAVRPPAGRGRCEEEAASAAPFPSFCRRRPDVLFSLAALGWLPPWELPPPLSAASRPRGAGRSAASRFVRFSRAASGGRRSPAPAAWAGSHGERRGGRAGGFLGGRGGRGCGRGAGPALRGSTCGPLRRGPQGAGHLAEQVAGDGHGVPLHCQPNPLGWLRIV